MVVNTDNNPVNAATILRDRTARCDHGRFRHRTRANQSGIEPEIPCAGRGPRSRGILAHRICKLAQYFSEIAEQSGARLRDDRGNLSLDENPLLPALNFRWLTKLDIPRGIRATTRHPATRAVDHGGWLDMPDRQAIFSAADG